MMATSEQSRVHPMTTHREVIRHGAIEDQRIPTSGLKSQMTKSLKQAPAFFVCHGKDTKANRNPPRTNDNQDENFFSMYFNYITSPSTQINQEQKSKHIILKNIRNVSSFCS